MSSTPSYKNLSALVEQPTSRAIMSDSSGITQTRIYCAIYSVCQAAIKARNTAGTGDLTGYIIKQSGVTRQKGDLGILTDVWLAGGPDGDPESTPLPPDTFSLQSQDLNPSVEKNINFADAALDTTRYAIGGGTGATTSHKTLIAWVRESGLSTDPMTSNTAWNALVGFVTTPGGAKFDQALVLADLLRRGIQNFYKASFVYTWEQSYFAAPSISVGGYIETPGGPLASAISGLGLVCLRQADDLQNDGLTYRLSNKWICAQDDNATFWEPILYS